MAPEELEQSRPPALGRDIARAGRGILRLVRRDPAWTRCFDLTTGGFLRSFFAPALALPLYVVGSALVERAFLNGRPAPPAALWGAGLAHAIDALGYPLLIALIARPIGAAAGYAAFIVVTNWASLYLNALLAAASLLLLAGPGGFEVFRFITLILLCLSVFFVWRAGRETLSRDIAPVLLVVVLFVAVSAMADQASDWLVAAASSLIPS